jgi:hypothetical protein
LNLSDHEIRVIPDSFCQNENLRSTLVELRLECNSIDNIPESLQRLTSLTVTYPLLLY